MGNIKIAWGYTSGGRQPALEAFNALDPAIKTRFRRNFKEFESLNGAMANRAHLFKSLKSSRSSTKELWEFKSGVTGAAGQIRLIGAYRPGEFVIVHVIRKKSDMIPRREIDVALRALAQHDAYIPRAERPSKPAAPTAPAAPPPEPPAPSAPEPPAPPPEPSLPDDEWVWARMRRSQDIAPDAPLYNNLVGIATLQAGAIGEQRIRAYLEQRIRHMEPLVQMFLKADNPILFAGASMGVELALLEERQRTKRKAAEVAPFVAPEPAPVSIEDEWTRLVSNVPEPAPVKAPEPPPPPSLPRNVPPPGVRARRGQLKGLTEYQKKLRWFSGWQRDESLSIPELVFVRHAESRNGRPSKRDRVLLARVLRKSTRTDRYIYQTYVPARRKWACQRRSLDEKDIVGPALVTDPIPSKTSQKSRRHTLTVSDAMADLKAGNLS